MTVLDTLAPLEEGQYPTGRYAEQTLRLQRELIAGGYLPALTSQGTPSDDGWMGPRTLAALQRRELDLAHLPLPPKPWWQSRRGQGAIKMGLGLVLSVIGHWWEPAAHVNSQLLVETVFAHLPTLLEALGLTVGVWGAGQSTVGAVQAQAPLAFRAARTAPDGVRGGLARVSADAGRRADQGSGVWSGARRRRNHFLDD